MHQQPLKTFYLGRDQKNQCEACAKVGLATPKDEEEILLAFCGSGRIRCTLMPSVQFAGRCQANTHPLAKAFILLMPSCASSIISMILLRNLAGTMTRLPYVRTPLIVFISFRCLWQGFKSSSFSSALFQPFIVRRYTRLSSGSFRVSFAICTM